MDPNFQINLMNLRLKVLRGFHRPLYFQEPSVTHYPLTNLEDLGNKIASLYRVLELQKKGFSRGELSEMRKQLDFVSEDLDLAYRKLKERNYSHILMN